MGDPAKSQPAIAGVFAALSAAAARERSAFGDRAGTPVLRVGRNPDAPWAGPSARDTPTSSASTSTPIATSAPTTGSGSNGSAATSCALLSRKSACRAFPTAASSVRSARHGMTVHVT